MMSEFPTPSFLLLWMDCQLTHELPLVSLIFDLVLRNPDNPGQDEQMLALQNVLLCAYNRLPEQNLPAGSASVSATFHAHIPEHIPNPAVSRYFQDAIPYSGDT
jgi:hypothetical protein